jgi:MFS family permease
VKGNSAFSERAYRRYFPASCLSTLGSWIVRFLLGWSAWELTHSAFWVGVTAALMLLPTFVLSPIFGILSDRINPRNGLLVSIGLHGLISLVAGLASLYGGFSLTGLLILASVLGAASAAHMPIRLALMPLLVRREVLPSAIGISAIVFNTSRILGPAVGAWLLAHFSLATAFFVSAFLFAAALPLLLSVVIVPRPKPTQKLALAREFREGISYVKQHRGIQLILAYTFMNGLLARTTLELLPAISGRLLDGDSATLATLTAAGGAGSIVGGLIVSQQSSQELRLLNLITAALVFGAVSLFALYWLTSLVAFAGVIIGLSMTTTIVGTATQSLAQLGVDEAYRGRVLSLWAVLAMGTPAIGALMMGAVADVLGFRLVFIGFALIGLLGVSVLYRKRDWLLNGPALKSASVVV